MEIKTFLLMNDSPLSLKTDFKERSRLCDFSKVTRVALIAGEGQLPLHVARNAQIQGISVVPFMIGKDSPALREICKNRGHRLVPGLMRRTLALLAQEKITHLVFAGKVNKWILLRDPRLDDLAVQAMSHLSRLNDDAIMLWLIGQLREQNIEVLPQANFLQDLFLGEGILTQRQPSPLEMRDIRYGFEIAKEMGRLDIGQTIVARLGMILAVEAIEGTDECLKRAGNISGHQGGVVVKVAKPDQDQRFDIPTVGVRTLKMMRKVGLDILVTEADRTLYLDPVAMTDFANRHGMLIGSISQNTLERFSDEL